MWKLWLDDQLDNPVTPARHVPNGFIGAKSCDEAIELVRLHGSPEFMDLDCDLGDGKDTKTFIRWLAEHYPDSPPEFNIHSANVAEGPNVASFLNSWRKIVKES